MHDLEERREAARERLEAKRDFRMHAAVYVTINLMLAAIWALSGGGHFWPIWVIIPWGVGLALNWWTAYVQHPITEAEIRREMDRDH